MKVEQSTVATNAAHAYTSEYEANYAYQEDFRTVFASVAQSADAPANERARVLLLLETLIGRLLALTSGQRTAANDLGEFLKPAQAPRPDGVAVRARPLVEHDWQSRFTERVHEHESTAFQASGTIRTADGRDLGFTLDLAMRRDFRSERTRAESGTTVLRDPLVISFAGKSAELSGQRFSFDLDADGQSEDIAGLGAGCGFLAIDRNADGRIDDGSELFGTRSGDGYADLRKLDGDGNGWLDEADAAFSALRVWQCGADGSDALSTLAEKGIGALYLGAAETPFSLTDADNHLLGQVRASGFYLSEDGKAGALQQVDLAV